MAAATVEVMTAHATSKPRDLGLLTRDDCMRLLSSVSVGRVVFTARALPAAALINYSVVDGEIVLRTESGSQLDAALHDTVVAFEADHIDRERRSGWSVVVVGRARPVTDPQEIAMLDALDLPRWLNSDYRNFVAVRPEFVSGRILVPAADTSVAATA